MDLLGQLAAQGILGLFCAILAIVVVYQNKIINSLQDKRLQDWQTTLNLSAEMVKKAQEQDQTLLILVQGLDRMIQQLFDKLDRRT